MENTATSSPRSFFQVPGTEIGQVMVEITLCDTDGETVSRRSAPVAQYLQPITSKRSEN